MAQSVQTPSMRRYGVLLVPVALVAWLLSGCGNVVTTKVIGMAAVTQGSDGHPVLLVKVCQDHIDTLSVFATREGLAADQPNAQVASWTSHQPASGTIEVAVEHPGASWRPVPSTPDRLTFRAARGYIVLGESSQQDVEVTQVSFRGRALQSLKPGQVLVRNSHVWSRDRFEREACPRDQD
jgi:hypothetical protein